MTNTINQQATICHLDEILAEQTLPTYSELVHALRKHHELLGMVSDFGTGTEGMGNPDDQNEALDRATGLLARIPA